jgi:flagellar M-ring protein FliF
MDFLNRAYGQVSDLLRSMTPSARITSGLLAVTIVVSLIYLFAFQLNGGNEYLLGAQEFSHGELEEMVKTFAASGLGDAKIVGNRIQVPRRKRVEYLRALSESNFSSEGFDSAMDAFLSETSGFFEPSELRELKAKHAIQKKMSLVVKKMDAVADATVQYDEHRKGGYPPVVEKTAVVAVRPSGRHQVDKELAKSIQRTICAAVAGMRPEDVTVTDLTNSRVVSGGDMDNDESSLYTQVKRMHEEDWLRRIENALDMYPGITVSVNVELDPEIQNDSTKVSYDPQSVPIDSMSEMRLQEAKPPVGGRPGAVPNEVQGNQPRELYTSNTPESTLEENKESQRSVTGHEHILTRKAPLIPSKVYASVGVPESYFDKVWRENEKANGNTSPDIGPPTPEQTKPIQLEIKKNIEDVVATLLGVAEPGVDVYPQINVFSFSDLPMEMPAEPSFAETGLVWLGQNWRALALLGVGLFSLLLLRGMIRSAVGQAAEEEAAPLDVPEPQTTTEEDEEKEDIISMLPKREPSAGLTLRQELSAIVKEDPDAAANVLRTWIGDAA